MTVQELIDELEKTKDKTWNVFVSIRGAVIRGTVEKIEENHNYEEEIIVLKTKEDI